MRNILTQGMLWFSALGCGVMAGVYFAFSAFVMTSLGRIDQAAGISAMNAISVDIVRSLFMPVFLGTTFSCAVLVVLGGLGWQEPGAIAMVCGGVLYLLGMFVVTMVFNVPLNDQLAATDPASSAAAPVWARYLTGWTFWNHVRTITSLAATALFIVAIAA
ncbi:anthrone oxygenase family protein [Bradyrhizobium sp. USDA 3364]